MKWLVAAASALFLLVVLGLATYAYFTPHLTMKAIHEAATSGNTRALDEHVDFTKVKASLKRQIKARIDEGAQQSANPFAALGSALAGALADPAVDTLVTSENVARVLRGEGLGSQNQDGVDLDDDSVTMRYDGLHRFIVTTERGQGFSFVLERDGALTWVLTEVRLPASFRLPNLAAGAPAPGAP